MQDIDLYTDEEILAQVEEINRLFQTLSTKPEEEKNRTLEYLKEFVSDDMKWSRIGLRLLDIAAGYEKGLYKENIAPYDTDYVRCIRGIEDYLSVSRDFSHMYMEKREGEKGFAVDKLMDSFKIQDELSAILEKLKTAIVDFSAEKRSSGAEHPAADAPVIGFSRKSFFGAGITLKGRPVSADLPGFRFAESCMVQPPHPPPPKKKRKPKRIVSSGFSHENKPDIPLKNTVPLKKNALYYYWFQIGKKVQGSIETSAIPLPEVPEKARLTVALFGYDKNLILKKGADTGEVEVHSDHADVIRQPVSGSDYPENSRYRKKRLFFPVTTPDSNGTFRMRCNIYWEQILLQSRIITAAVGGVPGISNPKKREITSKLDFTLSKTLSPADLNAHHKHKISILLNQNTDGTHSFHFYGRDGADIFKQDDVHLDPGVLTRLIDQGRGTLRIASWGTETEWTNQTYNYKTKDKNLKRLKKDLVNMAQWGYLFFDSLSLEHPDIFDRMISEPSYIQIAFKRSPNYLIPAALIYDYPLKTRLKSYKLCPTFLDAFEKNIPLEETACFNGHCPSKESHDTVCPSGFWGFRHYIGMPLSNPGDDLPSSIICDDKLTVAVGIAEDLLMYGKHVVSLKKLLNETIPGSLWNYPAINNDMYQVLQQSPHIVYFYCHGGATRNSPFIIIGPKGNQNEIDPSHFKKIVWEKPRPLVFFNGCHTTAVDPLTALNFVKPLVTRSKCAGVIGTEITIFEELATDFAEEFFRYFLAGKPVGEAIRNTRLKILNDGNPLGLVYIPFVLAGLSLKKVHPS
jgi:hypothetical protein